MIDYGSKKRNYNETSAAQFAKYVDKMNNLHPTQTPQYPGHLQTAMPMSPTEARAMQMQQMQMQQMLAQPNAVHMLNQIPAGPPAGFLGVPTYNPYGRPKF